MEVLSAKEYLRNQFSVIFRNHSKMLTKFALVGATGAILNLSILYFLTDYFSIWYILSAAIAIECSIIWNFFWNNRITFENKFPNRFGIISTAFKYHLSSLAGLAANLTALLMLTELARTYYIFSEVAAIMLAFAINYVISVRFVWNKMVI